MGRVQKDEPYSSVISSGSTSPRKWPLKSSCRQEARTDSCSESKSSWVVRRGETVTAQTQPHCPHYPEPLNSSACSSRIGRPLPQQKGPIQRRGRGSSCLGGSGLGGLGCFLLTSRTWSTISCMTSHWASVSLQSRRGRKSQGHRGEQRGTHTQHTRVHRDKTKALCGKPGCGGGLRAEPAAPWAAAKEKGNPHSTASTLLFRSSSTQNLGVRAWRAGKQGCPSQPTPRNLNHRRSLLCRFSHLSTQPTRTPPHPPDCTHQVPGRHPGPAPTSPSGAGALCPSGTHQAGQGKG